MRGEAWEVWREASKKMKMKPLKPSSCNSASGHTEEGTHLLAKNLRTWFLEGGLESLFGEDPPPNQGQDKRGHGGKMFGGGCQTRS